MHGSKIGPGGCSDLAPEYHAAIMIHELTINTSFYIYIYIYIYTHIYIFFDLIH